jgi:hypothetical protein
MFKIKFPEKIMPNQKPAMTKAVETLNSLDGEDKKEVDEAHAGEQAEVVYLKQYDKA